MSSVLARILLLKKKILNKDLALLLLTTAKEEVTACVVPCANSSFGWLPYTSLIQVQKVSESSSGKNGP